MSKVKLFPSCLFAIVFTIALLFRLYFAQSATFPGGGDYAFYYTVAKNLDAGRPFQIDYIWHYLNQHETITHSSLDFWAPLTSVLIFFSFRLFEQSTTAALIPAVISGILLSIPTYFLSRYLTKSPLVSWAAAFLVLFIPALFNLSITTESGIHYALFVNFSLLFMVKGLLHKPGYFLTAAVFAAFSHLTRLDGFLVMVVLFLTFYISRWTPRQKVAYLLGSAVLYLLLLIANHNAFGTLLPTAPAKAIWLQHYDDLFAFSTDISLESYLNWGPGNILHSKLQALFRNLLSLYQHLGFLLSLLLLFQIAWFLKLINHKLKINRLINQLPITNYHSLFSSHFPPILYLLLLLSVQTLIGTITSAGSFYRSSHAIIPYLIILAINQLYWLSKRLTTPISRRLGPALFSLMILFLGLYFVVQSGRTSQNLIQANNLIGENLAPLSDYLNTHQDTLENPPVLMVAFPWEVNLATGHPAVVLPRDGYGSLLQTASQYNVDYLLLPAPSEFLSGLYQGTESISKLEFIRQIPGTPLKLYRFRNESTPEG